MEKKYTSEHGPQRGAPETALQRAIRRTAMRENGTWPVYPAPLSPSEVLALDSWARINGRLWKEALRQAWSDHNYHGFGRAAELHGLRNRLGLRWLARFKMEGSSNG
jgi:hypothetical protein